jgi:antitoxin FitA
VTVASITIRNLDERTKARLRVRAARHGRSMEEEARVLLGAAVQDEDRSTLHPAESIRRRFQRLGGVLLRIEEREPIRDPPRLRR